MKTFFQPGNIISLAASRTVLAGQACLVGSVVGVAVNDTTSGATGSFLVEGCVVVAKTTGQAWTVGQLIYWDNTGFLFTSTVGSNKLVGVAIVAAASGDAIGTIRLNGCFIS